MLRCCLPRIPIFARMSSFLGGQRGIIKHILFSSGTFSQMMYWHTRGTWTHISSKYRITILDALKSFVLKMWGRIYSTVIDTSTWPSFSPTMMRNGGSVLPVLRQPSRFYAKRKLIRVLSLRHFERWWQYSVDEITLRYAMSPSYHCGKVFMGIWMGRIASFRGLRVSVS